MNTKEKTNKNYFDPELMLLDGSIVDPSLIDLTDDSVYYGDLGKLALSSSSCKLLLESPKKYKYATLYGNEATKPMTIGRLTHLMVLEPERVDEECFFVDVKTRSAKAFKEAENEYGAMTFTNLERSECEKIADAVLQNEAAVELLNKSQTEIGALKSVHGLPFRGKADILKSNHIIDLKTTTGISFFHMSANKYNYDLQAYLYQQLFNVDRFTFLVVDKSTLDIGVFETSDEFIERGKTKLLNAIAVYNEWFRGANLKDVDVSNYILRGTL